MAFAPALLFSSGTVDKVTPVAYLGWRGMAWHGFYILVDIFFLSILLSENE